MNRGFEYIQAAMWHGTLERAEQIRALHPDAATESIHAAAVSGDYAAVRRFIEANPASATSIGGPWGAQPIVYLALSRYLRLDPERSSAFVRAATALLDAGADPNAGFWSNGEYETALYGAAGVAHHAELTKLLLERGADPNDEEVVYHSGETYDNAALKLIVGTGSVTAENLSLMLIRKHDWHDYDGVKWLLENGADPNVGGAQGWSPIHHAIKRDNHVAIIDLLLDHGADPNTRVEGVSATLLAARHGRDDVLESIGRRGIPVDLPSLDQEFLATPGESLARFAGNGRGARINHLLDLGADVNATFITGDGYWDIAPNSTPLHVAAWRAQHEVVQLLIERGAAIDRKDGKGRTALQLAVKACVDSYWTERRAPDSVVALLRAGAAARDIALPTGYNVIDEILDVAQKTWMSSATPIFRVASLVASRTYYVDVLGFRIDWEYPTVIAAYRGGCLLFLSEGDQGDPVTWVWIGVGDVDILHKEFVARGAIIAQPPTNFEWACEMQVQDPDGNILRIGSDPKPGVPFGPWRDMYGNLWYARDDGSWESSHQEE